MKKLLLILVVVSMLINPIFAGEYDSVYDYVAPEEFTFLTLDGGLWNVGGNSASLEYNENIIEISTTNGSSSIDINLDGSYRYYKQSENAELNYGAVADIRLGTVTNSLSLTNGFINYTEYGLDVNGFDGFWSANGQFIVNATTNSITFTLNPSAALGVGRVYSINSVYRAKLLMEHLGVEPTIEKVKACVKVFETTGEIFNKFTNNDSELTRDFYEQLASAMGIPERIEDVILLNAWNSQEYAFQRARYANMVNGWDVRLAGYLNIEKNFGGTSIGVTAGPEAQIGGFLVEDRFYYEGDAQVYINYANSAFTTTIDTEARAVYLPTDYSWWAEAILEVDYKPALVTPLSFDLAGAGYYLINPNFRAYAGLRFYGLDDIALFGGGEIRLW